MMLEVGLRDYLLGIGALSALVHGRIFGLYRSQASDLPAVMIQRTHSMRHVNFCATEKLVSAQVQVDSYAMTGQDVWAVAQVLRTALVDFRKSMMSDTYVDAVFLENEFPLTDPDPGVIRVLQIYNFWYLED